MEQNKQNYEITNEEVKTILDTIECNVLTMCGINWEYIDVQDIVHTSEFIWNQLRIAYRMLPVYPHVEYHVIRDFIINYDQCTIEDVDYSEITEGRFNIEITGYYHAGVYTIDKKYPEHTVDGFVLIPVSDGSYNKPYLLVMNEKDWNDLQTAGIENLEGKEPSVLEIVVPFLTSEIESMEKEVSQDNANDKRLLQSFIEVRDFLQDCMD